jgi:hypothetical protein
LEEDAILSAMDEHEQSPLLFGGAVAAAFDESSSTSGHSSSDDSGNYSPTTISNGSSVFTEVCVFYSHQMRTVQTLSHSKIIIGL